MRLRLAGVDARIGGIPIVEGADLEAGPGELVGLIGPNGSGKSTLLRTVYRLLKPAVGTIHLDGDDLWRRLPARESARRTAVVAQESSGDFDFSVLEIAMMGRAPHKGLLSVDTEEDECIAWAALDRVGIAAKAGRLFSTLSGGEKQRVLLARALAQRSRLLILDEPTNHLDVAAQLDLLELVRELGVTTLAALHDLNLAAAYCDRVYVLAAGRVVAHGRVTDVLTPELMAEVFGVRAHCGVHPLTGLPHLSFAPLVHAVETPSDIPAPIGD